MHNDTDLTADQIIDLLELSLHPEGGYFRETFRDDAKVNGRSASTAIYFLVRKNQNAYWHKIDSAEMWHWYAGAAMELHLFDEANKKKQVLTLGNDFMSSQRPQLLVPPGAWQYAETLGDWTLVGCTVAPGFEFEHFELVPPNWEPK